MFKNIFGKKSDSPKETPKQNNSNIEWIPFTSVEQIEEIKEVSKTTSVGIFKHSTRCIISKTALQRFDNSFPKNIDIKMYFIDLLNYREVSNAVADEFQVIHQSPQLIIVSNEKAIFDTSHEDIPQVDLTSHVK